MRICFSVFFRFFHGSESDGGDAIGFVQALHFDADGILAFFQTDGVDRNADDDAAFGDDEHFLVAFDGQKTDNGAAFLEVTRALAAALLYAVRGSFVAFGVSVAAERKDFIG